MNYCNHFIGMDGHDYRPHGHKHKKGHNEHSRHLLKTHPVVSGVEFPGLLTDKGMWFDIVVM